METKIELSLKGSMQVTKKYKYELQKGKISSLCSNRNKAYQLE